MTSPAAHRGYIALISVLVISFTLLAFAVLAGENGFRSRANTSALENRVIAAHRARSCVFAALLHAAQESLYYSENEILWLRGKPFCIIDKATGTGEWAGVEASAREGDSIGRLQVQAQFASTSAITLTDWLEI